MASRPSKGRTFAVATGLAGLAVAGVWYLYQLGEPARAGLLEPENPEMVAQGQEIYAARCASCHGAGLEGEPDWKSPGADGLMPAPPHDETGHTWHHPDQVLFDLTKLGVAKAANLPGYKSAMPAFGAALSDREIVAVLSWIKAQWPAEVQAQHDQINARFAADRAR